MTDFQRVVPKGVVQDYFSGVMAASPERYGQMLEDLARQCNVRCDDDFKRYVSGVLSSQPAMQD